MSVEPLNDNMLYFNSAIVFPFTFMHPFKEWHSCLNSILKFTNRKIFMSDIDIFKTKMKG